MPLKRRYPFRRRYRRYGRYSRFRRRYSRVPRSIAVRRNDTIDCILRSHVTFNLGVAMRTHRSDVFTACPFTTWFYNATDKQLRQPVARYDDLVCSLLPVASTDIRPIYRGKQLLTFQHSAYSAFSSMYDMVKISSARCKVSVITLAAPFSAGTIRPTLYGMIDHHLVTNTRFNKRGNVNNPDNATTPDIASAAAVAGSNSTKSVSISSQTGTVMWMSAYPATVVERSTYVDCDYTHVGFNAVNAYENATVANDKPNFNPGFSFMIEQPSFDTDTTYMIKLELICHAHFRGSKGSTDFVYGVDPIQPGMDQYGPPPPNPGDGIGPEEDEIFVSTVISEPSLNETQKL